MNYVLILMMHVGPLGSDNSNAITTADFKTKASCEQALSAAKQMPKGTVKVIEGVCVLK